MKSSVWRWVISMSLFTSLPAALALMSVVGTAVAQQYEVPRTGGAWRIGVPLRGQNAAPELNSSIEDVTQDTAYSVVRIGVVDGRQSSFLPVAGTINNAGVVAGYSYNGDFSTTEPFLSGVGFIWKDGELQALPLLTGWPGAFAFGLNDKNQVFGAANNVDGNGNVLQTAVLWDHGTPINLGTLLPNSSSDALGMNNRGQVVGGSYSFDLNVETPFVWRDGQMTALPLPQNAVGGEADSINDRGQIVGFLDFGNTPPPGTGEYHSALWTPEVDTYVVRDLGTLGGNFGSAQDINCRGEVVGWATNAAGNGRAYRWDGGALKELGTLPFGSDSYAYSINDEGQIVGIANRFFNTFVPFLWRNGVMTDLNALVPADTPLLNGPPGGINNRGEIAANAFLAGGIGVGLLLKPTH